MGEPGGKEKLYRGGESERLGGGKDKIGWFAPFFFFFPCSEESEDMRR